MLEDGKIFKKQPRSFACRKECCSGLFEAKYVVEDAAFEWRNRVN